MDRFELAPRPARTECERDGCDREPRPGDIREYPHIAEAREDRRNDERVADIGERSNAIREARSRVADIGGILLRRICVAQRNESLREHADAKSERHDGPMRPCVPACDQGTQAVSSEPSPGVVLSASGALAASAPGSVRLAMSVPSRAMSLASSMASRRS